MRSTVRVHVARHIFGSICSPAQLVNGTSHGFGLILWGLVGKLANCQWWKQSFVLALNIFGMWCLHGAFCPGYSYLYIQHYPDFRCVFYFLTDWVSPVADNVPTLLSGCLVSAAYLFFFFSEIGSSILLPLMEQEREPTIKSILPNWLYYVAWLEVCTYTAIRSYKVFIQHSVPVSAVFSKA